MARGIIRKPSFNKIVGAYRSQWKRFWMRLFTFGVYGRKGMGWWRDQKKAWYNFVYYRTSISVYRLLGYKPSRLSCFFAIVCASIIGIVASPIDATKAGVTAHKIKKERKARAEGTSSRSGASKNKTGTQKAQTTTPRPVAKTYNQSPNPTTYKKPSIPASHSTSSTVKQTKPQPKTTPRKATTTTVKITPPVADQKKNDSYSYSYTPLFPKAEPTPYVPPKAEEPKEPDENTPKSKPMNEGDQYIRKRMIIAGSFYCNQEVISQLSVGTYFDLVAEPDNPHDKDAVALFYQGNKIGYVAKKDVAPFVICLKLRRNIYGVVTDIKDKDGRKEIEFETWFANKKHI